MRRTLIILALTLLALIGGLGLWGSLLPREHQAVSRITVPAPPESVYNVMRDIASLPTWWHDVQRVEPVQANDNWEHWKETSDGMSFTMRIDLEDPDRSFTTRIDTTGGALFGGGWTQEVKLAPGGGTTVTITENGWVGNPYLRLFMKVGGPHRTLDSYLTALSVKFGHPATPVHVTP